jgi:ribosomal protein L37AE/L43A
MVFVPKNMNKFRLRLYELYARYHLKNTCPKCPQERRVKRDIYNEGECYWYRNWKEGTYNIRTYQTFIIFKKLGIKKDLFLK